MESGYQETLDMINKKLTVEDHYNAVRILAETNMYSTTNLLINWPGESRESILATFRLADDLAQISPRLLILFGWYFPMPGTPLYEEAVKDGFEEPASNEEWVFNLSLPYIYRGFTRRQLEACRTIAWKFYRDRGSNPWPFQRFVWPIIRWRWRHGYFSWFVIGQLRRWYHFLQRVFSSSSSET